MLTDRKVATTVVQTVRDVGMRSFRAPGDFGSVTGLRGGSSDFDWSTAPHVFNDMHPVRFATDVAVSGDTDLNGDTTLTRFQVSVNGPGAGRREAERRGRVRFRGVQRLRGHRDVGWSHHLGARARQLTGTGMGARDPDSLGARFHSRCIEPGRCAGEAPGDRAVPTEPPTSPRTEQRTGPCPDVPRRRQAAERRGSPVT